MPDFHFLGCMRCSVCPLCLHCCISNGAPEAFPNELIHTESNAQECSCCLFGAKQRGFVKLIKSQSCESLLKGNVGLALRGLSVTTDLIVLISTKGEEYREGALNRNKLVEVPLPRSWVDITCSCYNAINLTISKRWQFQ